MVQRPRKKEPASLALEKRIETFSTRVNAAGCQERILCDLAFDGMRRQGSGLRPVERRWRAAPLSACMVIFSL
jgi:hypothetical protein